MAPANSSSGLVPQLSEFLLLISALTRSQADDPGFDAISRRKSRAEFSRLALERPYLFVFPAISAIAAVVGAHGVRNRRDSVPFYMVALIFAAAFGTLAISFWPYMIPFSITIDGAAAPHASLAFMFWGEGLFIFPLMLLYTAISYTVFSGKIRRSADRRH
jgi:cytochrome bd-type quinol oxidase subunit 2